ncbi:L-threonylcarbamoyladenylate synthase [Urechidicola croceus]|uniref:L-threonylcarbamoyladenylate synthase n=1 Tax=Urechidicola croceus TaxID=1850246 RepID=A0A1D8PBK0_9FLAO|nr:L-threonylcarbamoyladenylate synthase [Urechidicola croceus]AOW21959.1 threonylcarbamoyl-AMP synthase [Urechidicola croceus]
MKTELQNTIRSLQNNEIILYPTDTVWGIGCDATNVDAVRKIYQIKRREASKSMIILVNSLEMLQNYISNIPDSIIDILSNTLKPTTIIYNNPKGLAQNVVAEDNTVAIRIVNDEFCQKLIQKFGKPIVSTSANISGQPTPKSFDEISESILHSVDYVVNLHREKLNISPSSIIKLNTDGSISTLRE